MVVVSGGGAGIGAAIAEELGRNGVYVVTMDPMVTLDGAARLESSEQTTAQRIVAAGGAARAADISVTDAAGVEALFKELVADFGALDAVVNTAGITRRTDIANGAEEDWAFVLSVHLEGYLNVLSAALPIMVDAGHGRILGVTSGSGWRAANTGAYGCAKRGVAALTWQIGRALPSGVTVNALSPIAATRMVPGAGAGRPPNSASAAPGSTGGLSFGTFPPPDDLGPVGAYLASDEFSWCMGEIVFSGGSEAAFVSRPRLLEVVRTQEVVSLAHVFDAAIPGAFAVAEAAQASNGGSNPRFGPIFAESAGPAPIHGLCVVVTDDDEWGSVIAGALGRRGASCSGIGAWHVANGPRRNLPIGFTASSECLAQVAADVGPIEAVIVALAGGRSRGGASSNADWQQVLADHDGVAEGICTDAGWVRAVSDYAASVERSVRVVTITEAASSGGRSRAQAAAQLARAAAVGTSGRLAAFAIGVETAEEAERRSTAELAAHLVANPDGADLSGAELVAASGWVGLRSHPAPAGSITYGGPSVPDWFDGALRQVVSGRAT